jgi:glucan phosphoethanolaminetransferase (alkaline phosphatase superfamily)
VYPLLGFDKSHFIDDFNKQNIVRQYIKDEELYDKIIDQYKEKKADQKLFILGVTMQNHGGYTDYYPNFANSVTMTNGYYGDVNQYLSLIHESDSALKKLITYFQGASDKVEIVFFGDHQPSLNSSFYRQLNGKGLSGLTVDELENLFKVPFFIWTNYSTPKQDVPLTSLNYLSTLTLERANIELPTYNRFLKDMMEVVPAMNSRAYYSSATNSYLHYPDASGTEKKLLQKYEMLQYNNMFDKKNKSKEFFPFYAANESGK